VPLARLGLAGDDNGVAVAVGAVLLLALLVTVYGVALQAEVPRAGAVAERQWENEVEAAFAAFAVALGRAVGDGASAEVTLPGPPQPEVVAVPLLPPARPAPPGGTLTFEAQCAGFSATHTLPGEGPVTDLAGAATGCLRFRPSPAHAPMADYVYELGGVLRVQEGRAVVLQGPSFVVNESTPGVHRVTFTLAGLRGPSQSTSAAPEGVPVQAVVAARALEQVEGPNAAEATWLFSTRYADAWRVWFEEKATEAGLPPSALRVRCLTDKGTPDLQCAVPEGRLGTVEVYLRGRNPQSTVGDLQVSLSYAVLDLRLG